MAKLGGKATKTAGAKKAPAEKPAKKAKKEKEAVKNGETGLCDDK